MSSVTGARSRRAIISGYVTKMARESTGLSQEELASRLGANRTTVQGWESGRRPLTAVSYGDAVALQQRLLNLGARPDIIAMLPAAVDADLLLAAVLDQRPEKADLDHHPLAWTVLSHAVVEMLLWATAGHPPRICATLPETRRFGPVADRPELGASETTAFFANLRVLAARAVGRESHLLVHRQAVFLASADGADSSKGWKAAPKTLAHFRSAAGWTPYWPAARSLAIALARAGDATALGDFISQADADPDWDTANLNYWAYWCGDIGARQPNDEFMIDRSMPWRGTRLYAHLTTRLDPESSRVDLNIHTLWSLLTIRPSLPADDPVATAGLVGQAERLLDSGGLSERARSELGSVRYALAVQGHTST